MGSPITFSGFNQIDFGMILNAVMEQERAPLRVLENQKKTLETQNTTFGTFLGKLSTLESAMAQLARADSLASLTATSSDPGVGASATAGTLQGNFSVVVHQLAQAQVTASASRYDSADAVVGTGGTLSMQISGSPPVDITLTGPTTLTQLAEMINGNPDAPVAATVVQAAPGSYQLVLTGRAAGAAQAFTVTGTLSGGENLSFDDTPVQTARDASLTVNNLPIVSASNSVQGVIPGVTLTLTREDPTKTVMVGVARDTAALTQRVETFVTAYNDILAFMKEQDAAAVGGRASIARDPLLRGFRDAMRFTLMGDYSDGGGLGRLPLAGIEFEQTGKLKLNRSLFDSAVATSPGDLQTLFAGAGGNGGAFGALVAQVKTFTESGGLVAAARQRLGDQVSSITKRLDSLEGQLNVRRAALSREFIAADLAMSQLNAQGLSLNQLGGMYRLF